jgi:threonine/homoserine/homoserine lactone efflux protein
VSIYLVQGLALGFAAAVQPGPLMVYLITQTLTHGFRKTWVAAFAPLVSDGPIIILAMLVLSQMPGALKRGLNVVSGIFILYLALGAFKQWRIFTALDEKTTASSTQSLLKAALMNALSPMPYIYWSLVTGPILIEGWKQSPTQGLIFLISFYGVMICGLLTILAIFSAARNLGNQISRVMLGISVLMLAGFGMFQIWQGWLP